MTSTPQKRNPMEGAQPHGRAKKRNWRTLLLTIFWAYVAAFASKQSRHQIALSKLEAVHLLESWAFWQQSGRLKSVRFPGVRSQLAPPESEASGLDEGLWRWLHVEKFWDERTQRFRDLALFVAGHMGEPQDFVWRRNPARSLLQSLIEVGWAFVSDWQNPIPEAWALFVLEWNDWISENPCPRTPTGYDEDRGEPDVTKRLVSIRTACEIRNWELSTVRRWCLEGKILAVRHGDWAIPLGVVMSHDRPPRGGKREGAGRTAKPKTEDGSSERRVDERLVGAETEAMKWRRRRR